jgi:hypothetical protein
MTNLEAGDTRIRRIKELYAQDSYVRTFCDYLAARGRNGSDWSLDNLEGPTRLSRSNLIYVFRKLEMLRLGRFVVGRRGYSSRFDWAVSPLSVGKIAVGEAQNLTPFTEDEPDDEEGPIPNGAQPGTLSHTFRLRADFVVEFRLPTNLNQTEAARLADFIKTLPFTS